MKFGSPTIATGVVPASNPLAMSGPAADRNVDHVGAGFLFPVLDRDLDRDRQRAVAQFLVLGRLFDSAASSASEPPTCKDELTTMTCVSTKALVIGAKSFSGLNGIDL